MIFVFSSVTAAKRVEKTIAKYGVLSQVIHTPKVIGKGGCSHSVRFKDRDYELVEKIIAKSEINPIGAYYEIFSNGACVYSEVKI